MAGRAVEKVTVLLDRARVLADQPRGELFDDGAEPLGAVALHELGPAGYAIVCRDLEKGIDPPAGVAMQGFDLGDFH